MRQLGIEHIAAYSPEARGRSERAFSTRQERLPRERAKASITTMDAANSYLDEVYRPRHNAEFAVPAREHGSAYVPFIGSGLPDILCEQDERTVGNDNCVSFAGMKLQIPASRLRYNYVKTLVRVRRYVDGTLAVFHGPRRLAIYRTEEVSMRRPNKQPEVRQALAARGKPASGYALRRFPAPMKKRTFHLLQNRTFLFVLDMTALSLADHI